MSSDNCPVCHSELISGYKSWHFICRKCGYEKSNLEPTINLQSSHQSINEDARESGLRELRINNFKHLLSEIKLLKSSGLHLLDVGCAHGWFLDIAHNNFEVLGLEPDKHVFDTTYGRGLTVRNGYFPDVLNENEKFDIIVFNDVIEHIPDIETILASCNKRLNKDGLLVLNLPSSNGVFYILSKVFCRFGYSKFFDRLWQKGLPSPHLHYFNKTNLNTLLNSNGFHVNSSGTLPTLGLSGLYTRISYTGKLNVVTCVFIYICVALLLPLLKVLPSDIIYTLSTRND